MSYCSKKKERLWKDMQVIWRKEIIKKCNWKTLYQYNFKDNEEWSLTDYEQSPFCQIIWGEIIAEYLSDENKKYTYKINRYYLIVYNIENEKDSYRFLFDVMYNLKKKYIQDSSVDEKYHFIGNFAPLPANNSPKRSLQFIHKDNNEDWSKIMDHLSENWNEFNMKGLTFKQYKDMVFLTDYKFVKSQTCVTAICRLIENRGKNIQKKCSKLLQLKNVCKLEFEEIDSGS